MDFTTRSALASGVKVMGVGLGYVVGFVGLLVGSFFALAEWMPFSITLMGERIPVALAFAPIQVLDDIKGYTSSPEMYFIIIAGAFSVAVMALGESTRVTKNARIKRSRVVGTLGLLLIAALMLANAFFIPSFVQASSPSYLQTATGGAYQEMKPCIYYVFTQTLSNGTKEYSAQDCNTGAIAYGFVASGSHYAGGVSGKNCFSVLNATQAASTDQGVMAVRFGSNECNMDGNLLVISHSMMIDFYNSNLTNGNIQIDNLKADSSDSPSGVVSNVYLYDSPSTHPAFEIKACTFFKAVNILIVKPQGTGFQMSSTNAASNAGVSYGNTVWGLTVVDPVSVGTELSSGGAVGGSDGNNDNILHDVGLMGTGAGTGLLMSGSQSNPQQVGNQFYGFLAQSFSTGINSSGDQGTLITGAYLESNTVDLFINANVNDHSNVLNLASPYLVSSLVVTNKEIPGFSGNLQYIVTSWLIHATQVSTGITNPVLGGHRSSGYGTIGSQGGNSSTVISGYVYYILYSSCWVSWSGGTSVTATLYDSGVVSQGAVSSPVELSPGVGILWSFTAAPTLSVTACV